MTERRMREGATTEDYRHAMDGEGDFGSLGYEWSDKPHRLVYDLCGEVNVLRDQLAAAAAALKPFSEALDCVLGEQDSPDNMVIWDTGACEAITVGDLRRARAALAKS